VLQERSTYEIMRPEDVGYVGQNLVLGKHSGRHAFRDRVAQLGFNLDDAALQRAFDDFIALADRKKEIYDTDITALIENRLTDNSDRWKLKRFHTSAGTGMIPTATLEMQCESDEPVSDAATGDGPIDAVFRAMERIMNLSARLEEFNVRSVSEGKDAQGEVHVAIAVDGRQYSGRGVSTEIIEAAATAYLRALNQADNARRTPAAGTAAADHVKSGV
jgi:2-isopropylmalate synthase